MNNCSLEQINIGQLPSGTFPKDDGRTYIYKRPNGHIYVYSNGSEKHICCDDGLINSIPIFEQLPTEQTPIHLPDDKHIFIFFNDGILYGYDKDLNIVSVVSGEINWSATEW